MYRERGREGGRGRERERERERETCDLQQSAASSERAFMQAEQYKTSQITCVQPPRAAWTKQPAESPTTTITSVQALNDNIKCDSCSRMRHVMFTGKHPTIHSNLTSVHPIVIAPSKVTTAVQ